MSWTHYSRFATKVRHARLIQQLILASGNEASKAYEMLGQELFLGHFTSLRFSCINFIAAKPV